MQMYWSDYFGDTRHLTCEQHGAYLQLIGSMWLAGGKLANDAKKLAKITGCTASRWAKIQAEVMELFEVCEDTISHKRVMFELKKAQEKSIKRAEVGSLGGKAKSLKNNETDVAIATVLLKHLPEPEPEPEPDISNEIGREVAQAPSPKVSPNGFRLPSEWEPNPWTEEISIDVMAWQRELDKFRDYWRAVPGAKGRKLDWDATWRNWIRRASEDQRPHAQPKLSLAEQIGADNEKARQMAFARLKARNGQH